MILFVTKTIELQQNLFCCAKRTCLYVDFIIRFRGGLKREAIGNNATKRQAVVKFGL